MAAHESVRALDSADFSHRAFIRYETYVQSIRRMLFDETDMYHRSFNLRETYERVMFFKLLFGALDSLPKQLYHETDPYAYDLLNPWYVQQVHQIRQALHMGEQGLTSSAQTIQRVHALVESLRQEILRRDDLAGTRWGMFFNHYTDTLERVEVKDRARAIVEIAACSMCHSFADATLLACPTCGTTLR
jgi:hypothetical protein